MAAIEPRPSSRKGYQRKNPERDEQIALFRFLRAHQKRFPALSTIYAVPNGLFLLPGVAGQAVAQGVLPGVWDICVPISTSWRQDDGERVHHSGLWIEMKAGKNTLTTEQKRFQTEVINYSSAWCMPRFRTVYSWIEAGREITDYLKITDKAILDALR